jgi:hypothetical protein
MRNVGVGGGAAYNPNVVVVNNTGDDGTAALLAAMDERYAHQRTVVKLAATAKQGNDEKIANTLAQIAVLDTKIAALKG